MLPVTPQLLLLLAVEWWTHPVSLQYFPFPSPAGRHQAFCQQRIPQHLPKKRCSTNIWVQGSRDSKGRHRHVPAQLAFPGVHTSYRTALPASGNTPSTSPALCAQMNGTAPCTGMLLLDKANVTFDSPRGSFPIPVLLRVPCACLLTFALCDVILTSFIFGFWQPLLL